MTGSLMPFLMSLALILAAMTLLWLLSLRLRNASIVDPFWGIGFVLVVRMNLWSAGNSSEEIRSGLLAWLTSLWGVRLSAYLLWRNFGHGEDRRYRSMREKHGTRFWWVSLLTVFWLQAVILWVVALPLQVAILMPEATTAVRPGSSLGWTDVTGICVWLIGFLFESVADLQMAVFQSDPANAGQVMDRGLWKLTRHPNYFGDFCVWWGLYLIAASAGATWTIFSPLLMSFLLMKVSGVTLLEQTITTRRPGYAEYQARTSSFFPWPPRR